eukprot:9501313-Pyramimonas_sp.AAC.1
MVLAIRMYMSVRRLSWDGCFSTQVPARHGVLPGCAFATVCLQCIMLTPFDSLYAHASHISRSLHVYADDIT